MVIEIEYTCKNVVSPNPENAVKYIKLVFHTYSGSLMERQL